MAGRLVVGHFLHGQNSLAPGARCAPVFNPALGRAVRDVAMATAADVDAAVRSAKSAQPAWARTPALQRSRVLFRFKELLGEQRALLARTISEEHGKTIADADGEITRGMEVVEFACGAPQLLKGEFSEGVGTGVDCYGVRQPLGVAAGITPFNFPAMVPMWMFPVALVCGNAFILKPSERDPSVSLLLAELLQQAGLPDGVFSVVQGDGVAAGAGTAEALIERLGRRIAALKVGAPDAAGVDMGPLVNDAARTRVLGYIDSGVGEGAALVVDGRGVRVPGREDGFYVGPTL